MPHGINSSISSMTRMACLRPTTIFDQMDSREPIVCRLYPQWAYLSRELGESNSAARRAIVLGYVIHGVAGGLVVILAILRGVMGPAGWLAVPLYLGLGLAYLYCAWKPESV